MKMLLAANCLAACLVSATARADIYRWDTGEVIPGTEGITPGPGVDLAGMQLGHADLSGFDLSGVDFSSSNLTLARFYASDLTKANFTSAYLYDAGLDNANVAGANFYQTTNRGFKKEQLYSTASYQSKDLRGIQLALNDLRDWDFRGQDLHGATLFASSISNADFTGADVAGALFYSATSFGFTKEQLYSTASYQEKNLRGINLSATQIRFGGVSNLEGWDFSDQDLTGADFSSANLTGANFAMANLQNVNFDSAFGVANLLGANFTAADTRGASRNAIGWSIQLNTILRTGLLERLNLLAGDTLRLHDDDGIPSKVPQDAMPPRDPIAVTIAIDMTVADGGTLELLFEADEWNSLISFEPNIAVQLGGTLELSFAEGVDVATQIGRTINAFDWTGVEPAGTFTVASLYPWDVSRLYSDGEVTLLLPGDTNDDGVVDLGDLNNVRNNFGATGDEIVGDTNHDGVVDLVDLNNVRNFFGVATAAAVPEPDALLIAGVLCFAGLAARFRR